MKFHIAYPAAGTQITLNIEDDNVIRAFVDKRMSHQVLGDVLGEQWKGYVLKITGGHDVDGFAMKQGILTSGRVRLLLKKGDSNLNADKKGLRKRRSVLGCIVSHRLSVVNLAVVKKGESEIDNLTTINRPASKLPKRASKLRRLFNLEKKDDITQVAVKKIVEGKQKRVKSPKIQRIVDSKRHHIRAQREKDIKVRYTKTRQAAEEFNALVALRRKQFAADKAAALSKKRSLSRKLSEKAQ